MSDAPAATPYRTSLVVLAENVERLYRAPVRRIDSGGVRRIVAGG